MATIKLNKLSWDNMYSFGAGNSLELSASPLSQISAPNGYGKSSIPLIIEEVLFNKNSKGVAKGDIANRTVGKGYSASLDFTKDADAYEIKIQRSGATIKVALIKNGSDISSHTAPATYKEIEEILGMDFKTCQRLVNQNIATSLQFMEATDTTRKKFLIDLFDMSEYLEYHEIFKKELSVADQELKLLRAEVNTVNSLLKTAKAVVDNGAPTAEIKELPEEISAEEIGAIKNQISSYNTKVSQRDTALANKEKLEQLTTDLVKYEVDSLEKESDAAIQKALGKAQSDALAATNMIKKLKSLNDECPTCLQSVTSTFKNGLIAEATETLETNTNLYNDLNEKLNLIKSKNSAIDTYLSKKATVDIYNAKVTEIPEFDIVNVTELKARLDSLQKEIAENKAEIDRIRAHNSKVELDLVKFKVQAEQLASLEERLTEVSSRSPELEQRVRDLTILRDAFGTNGLIAYKLENMVKDLEQLSNFYLSKLSRGRFVLEFKLEGEKLNVLLYDGGNLISIASPSSGERARINISTLLAIRSLMSSISKNTINVLFLDEVISVMDSEGLEALVEVLLEEHNLNTFLVAHSWSHPLVDSIAISKDANGISSIS